jgi:hypothetical protein
MAQAEVERLLESAERVIKFLPAEEPIARAFASWLDQSLGREAYPASLAGDLAHFFVTIEFVYQRMAATWHGAPPIQRSRALALLWALRFDLLQSLNPLSRDLAKDLSVVIPRRAREIRE